MEIINKEVLDGVLFIEFKYESVKYLLVINFRDSAFEVKTKGSFRHFTILDSFGSKYVDQILNGKTVESFDLSTENEVLSHITVLLNIMNNGPYAITQHKRAS